MERAEGGSDGSTTAISPGSVLALAALVALVTAVVSTIVIVQLLDDDRSQDEMAAVLRGELREFVLERTAEPPATTTTTSIPQLPVDDDLLGHEGETFPTELATLTVHTDGCGVIRTEFEQNPRNLTWSVKDVDGFEVLGRNAEGETRYRYFQPGTYTVELEAWNGDNYAPVSNRVTINC